MSDRITQGLVWLANEVGSASVNEFRAGNQPGGDMLLSACITAGYVNTRADRIALSETGRRRLQHLAPIAEPEVE